MVTCHTTMCLCLKRMRRCTSNNARCGMYDDGDDDDGDDNNDDDDGDDHGGKG